MIRCVSWLVEWLKSLDWSHWDNVLSATVGVTVLVGIAWAAIKFVLNPLAEWLGRRRAQAKLLDQLACGSSVDYVESLFGVAQFVGQRGGNETRTYNLPGAWVVIEIRNNAVYAFGITITRRRMHYNTKRLTFGNVNLRLGKDKFPLPSIACTGERLWIGVHRWGYARQITYKQNGLWHFQGLSYNMAGAGSLGWAHGAGMFERGSLCESTNTPCGAPSNEPLDSQGITVNTLSVLSPDAVHTEVNSYVEFSVDDTRSMLAATTKPPVGSPHRNNRWRIKWNMFTYKVRQRLTR